MQKTMVKIYLYNIFKKKNSGIYVDIGCNLPKSRSLTYLLYKKLMGIKVDISQINKVK